MEWDLESLTVMPSCIWSLADGVLQSEVCSSLASTCRLVMALMTYDILVTSIAEDQSDVRSFFFLWFRQAVVLMALLSTRPTWPVWSSRVLLTRLLALLPTVYLPECVMD